MLGLIGVIVFLVLMAQPLFVILGSITLYSNHFFAQQELTGIVEDIFFAGNKEILVSIPLFILAGNLMTEGSISARLIRIAKALTAGISGGLGLASVLACTLFAAISGSSPVTMVAVGSVLYPALQQSGYSKKFAMGVLSSGGTLGIIIPPSIPMILFAIMAGVSVVDLFKAGVGPGILLASLLAIYSLYVGRKEKKIGFQWSELREAFREGFFSLFLPFLILGGIYSGFFTATESAAVAVFYALFIEILIHREVKLQKLFGSFIKSVETMGILFLLLVIAVSFNKFLTLEQIPQIVVDLLKNSVHSKFEFLLGVNILLLIVGCFMDIMSAILVLAPLLLPLALHFGMNPIHFGIIMIVNLEIGYLTPPVGVNLFVGSSIFKEPLGNVVQAVLPFILVLLFGLVIITAFPQILFL